MKILLPGKALSRHIEKYWYTETNRVGDYLVSEYYPDGNTDLDQHAVECIEESGGTKNIGEISREMGISIRQLERRVTNLVGLSPKVFSRTVRLQRILATLCNGYPHRLTDLAYQNGYSDQSHFIRDIKVMTGRTPGYFSRAQRIDSRITYLPVVKPLEYCGELFHRI